ncbi:hypothetical protein C7999DRAFT_43818 [Corynascus novoguineensis]|uniref:UBC core domain-containing protein n=1 Tax=Corynascus novoguineensis TaxID=1126955 RepID=A0AAN7HGH9_9PEZI|nr:hypothetical protein C7999DRAFT_43818 [Corynascus novoguineensis]
MPSFRSKLHKTSQRWRRVLKRCINRENDMSQGPKAPKRLRTGKTTDADLTRFPSNIGPSRRNPTNSLSGNLPISRIRCRASPMDFISTPSEATHIDQQYRAEPVHDRSLLELMQTEMIPQSDDFPTPTRERGSLGLRVGADPFDEYRTRLMSRVCVGCKTATTIDATEIIRRTGKMLKGLRYLHPFTFCSRCKGWSCTECSTYHPGNDMPVLKHVSSTKDLKTAWCCDQGRIFLIFSLLCGLESTPPSRSRTIIKWHTKASSSLDSPLAAQSKGRSWRSQSQLSRGTGYGDTVLKLDRKAGQTSQDSDDHTKDLQLYFEALSLVLPSNIRKGTAFDCCPQPVVSEMLRRSPMMEHASKLLRYASIEEINKRYDSITAVFDFVETISSHISTCPLLLSPRILYPPEEQLLYTMLGTSAKKRPARVSSYETAQSLSTIAEHLAVPCRKFIQASSRVLSISTEKEGEKLLAMVQRICNIADGLSSMRALLRIEEKDESRGQTFSFSNHLAATVTTRGMRASTARGAGEEALQEVSKKSSDFHRANCVKEVPDDLIVESSYFAKDAREAEKLKPAPGRMRKLLAQIASLSTDLPQGIYVRHGESRIDVLKILIIGPADTPYEHGLFEFDMFCGSDFPERPPKMFFRTTGGGSVRFNPNLYHDGKVCFSLLGTWEGQPWDPDGSSILQLLVSIQAMIFNDQPYYNEPGYEYRRNFARAQAYNRNIEHLTVRYALVSWLAERLAGPTQPSAPLQQLNSKETPASHHPTQGKSSQPPVSKHPHGVATNDIEPEPWYPAKSMALKLDQSTVANLHTSSPLPVQWQSENTTSHEIPAFLSQMQSSLSHTDSHIHYLMPSKSLIDPESSPTDSTYSSTYPTFSQASTPFSPTESLLSSANLPLFPTESLLSPDGELVFFSSLEAEPRDAPQPLQPPPKEDDIIFGDIIREHFRLKAKIIMETVQKWEKQAGRHSGIVEIVGSLGSQLKRHGFIQ